MGCKKKNTDFLFILLTLIYQAPKVPGVVLGSEG